VCFSVLAMGVLACAMAIKGWQVASLALGAAIAFVAGVMVFQVHRSARYYRARSGAMRRAARQAEEHYAEVLGRIVHFVEARDRYTIGHSGRVGKLGRRTAQKLGLPAARCDLLGLAGELHDIGLFAVPDRILAARAQVTADGYRDVKTHPAVSCEVLKPLSFLADVLPAIRHHHERMNGTGYPDGLRGQAIPLEARVLAVADAYDAMTHDRPHRRAMTPSEAMRELRRCTPAGYAPACVDALAEVVHVGQREGTDALDRPAAQGRPAACARVGQD
jgi:HD-GYP domain-containing protein (c-di-GMP phosphodiesterase class II)